MLSQHTKFTCHLVTLTTLDKIRIMMLDKIYIVGILNEDFAYDTCE